ncbi:MAG TPA: LacI family DNA-binding transcriptional regulator [Chthonomonadaceae bacterium]|nr:LacI family DNA-binding transcriptional regulator [Chthonomonadaceae bacterium]
MSRDKKAPTLSDIAACAGVSPYTVSVVLNGSRSNTRVSSATRDRILEAAARLKYHPNAMARGLVRRRTHAIGVLYGVVGADVVITNAYSSGVLQGILSAAAEAGYCVTIYTDLWRGGQENVARYRDGRTDGILVVAPQTNSSIVPDLSSLGIFLAVVSSTGAPYGVPSVDVDDFQGGRLATQHLLELGHTRIAHLTGNLNMQSAPLRRDAYCAALRDAGVEVRPEYILETRYDGETVDAAVQALMRLPEPPTALFAGNDTIALAAMQTAQQLGLSIPEDLSLVGFDDTPAASLVTPSLSSVQQPLQQISAEATRLLIAQIEGETVAPDCRLLAPQLVVRHSTAPFRAR